MKTSDKRFLNRDGLPREAQGVLDRWGGLIDQVVNYGTHLMPILDVSGKGFHDLSVSALTLHAIELLDGISLLIRRAAIAACEPLLRSLIETTLQVEYMLKDDSVRRGLAYYVQHLHAQRDWAEKGDPTTEKGKQFAAVLQKDKSMDGFVPLPIDSGPIVTAVLKQLGKPAFVTIESEWERLRKAKPKRKFWWYSLFDGPDSIESLAKSLDKHGWYEILYRIYSGSSHGSDALRSLQYKKGEGLFYRPLRYPHGAKDVGILAVSVTVGLFSVLCAHYAKKDPGKSARWYVTKIRGEFQALKMIRFTEGKS